jgi:hypothetical protein
MRLRSESHPANPTPTEECMFYAKMNDEEDDELSQFEEDDEEGQETSGDGTEEIDEIIIVEEEPEDEDAGPSEKESGQSQGETQG